LLNAIQGYNERETFLARTIWEAMRWSTFTLLNIQLTKESKLRKLEDLLPLPWDEENKPAQYDKKDLSKLFAKMDAFTERQQNE